MLMERVIRFPLPKYEDVFDSLENLKIKPYCVCYQHDVNENGYGPYGFHTEKSKRLLEDVFGKIVGLTEARRMNFYGNLDEINTYIIEKKNYQNVKKKTYYWRDTIGRRSLYQKSQICLM